MMSLRVSASGFLLVSLVIHIGSMQAFAVPDTTPSAASPPAALVSQGNSFADMVAGSPESLPETIAAIAAEQTESPEGIVLDPEEVTTGPVDILAVAAPSTAQAVPMVAPTMHTAAQPDRLAALPDVKVNDANLATMRPTQRPSDLGQTVASGNSDQDARRGTVTENQQDSRQAQPSGQGQQVDEVATQAPREAAANYGNTVMRKISRTRQERIRERGTAIVQFRVAASGQLESIGIAQSSGNANLDSAAVNHIRRSAPFPTPPAGATTSFTIPIEWR